MRTNIHINPLRKFSFFLSGPLPPAFSLNVLYRADSIFNQAWQYVVMAFWIISVFKRNLERAVISKLLYIAIVFILLALIYLPLLIIDENFASYRTLFAFNLAVFIMVMEAILSFFSTQRFKSIFSFSILFFLLLMGFYNFNIKYINPLKIEYRSVKAYFNTHYDTTIQRVHFIRADKNLFKQVFSINSIKDEFAAPSTTKDWVPEPLIKQFIYERTGNKKFGEQTEVVQFGDKSSFAATIVSKDSVELLVDVNQIVLKK